MNPRQNIQDSSTPATNPIVITAAVLPILALRCQCDVCIAGRREADEQFGEQIRAAGRQYSEFLKQPRAIYDQAVREAESEFSLAAAQVHAQYDSDFCKARDAYNASDKQEAPGQIYSAAIHAVSATFNASLAGPSALRDAKLGQARSQFHEFCDQAQRTLTEAHRAAHAKRDAVLKGNPCIADLIA
jgi:hypothetical protein